MTKILLVEDNVRLAERISHYLRQKYVVDVAQSGNDAIEKSTKLNYTVIVLDLGLPDMSGYEVCEKLRFLNVKSPIMVLTGNANMAERIRLLNAGADDYVTKPFNTEELKARILAASRRQTREHIKSLLTYKDIIINLDEHKVSRAGSEIPLRRKEFDILEYLITNKGRILTRKMIMDHVWSTQSNSWTSTVDVHIKHLRDKIDRPFKVAYIKTAYGLGYKVDEL